MAWPPSIEVKSIYCPAIVGNLLTYFSDETRQAEALAWAHGSALRRFANIANSVANRKDPVFPAIAFSDDNEAVDMASDDLIAIYSVVFELMIQNADPFQAVVEARSYTKAVKSMIANCPKTVLAANTGAAPHLTILMGLETGFDEIRTNEMQNDFMQMVQIRATFQLHGASN